MTFRGWSEGLIQIFTTYSRRFALARIRPFRTTPSASCLLSEPSATSEMAARTCETRSFGMLLWACKSRTTVMAIPPPRDYDILAKVRNRLKANFRSANFLGQHNWTPWCVARSWLMCSRMRTCVLPASGKTCLMRCCISDTFKLEYYSTIAVDYAIRIFDHNDLRVKLQIVGTFTNILMQFPLNLVALSPKWDFSGQDRYRTIISSYWRTGNATFVTFDLTSRESFAGMHILYPHSGYHSSIMLVHSCAFLGDRYSAEGSS